MKKALGLIVMGFMLALPAAALAHPCDAPFETDLIAGQHYQAGTLEVCNDGDLLYITYRTTSGWRMIKTHLHVANSLEGIPQNQPGNPILGHFAYKMEWDYPGVSVYTETIALNGWDPCTVLYIAAHADVISPEGSEGAWADGTRFSPHPPQKLGHVLHIHSAALWRSAAW